MKRLIIPNSVIVVTILLLTILHSCNFLEIDVKGKVDTNTFFADIDGLRIASTGLNSCAYKFFDSYILKYGEVAGDNLQAASVGSETSMYYQYNFLSKPDQETTAVGYIWRQGYVIVTNANNILYYTPGLKKIYPNDVEEITRIEGQALFMRALAHMSLLLCYSQPYSYTKDASHLGVPLVTYVVGTNEKLSRDPVNVVYNQIISDLKEARTKLNNIVEDTDYVSGPACDALLARVYLYMKDYKSAEEYSTKLISQFELTPHDKYLDMFTGEEKGSEAIFRLTGKYSSRKLRQFYDYESPSYVPTDEFVASFSDDDIRLKLLHGPNGHKACMKYYDLRSDSSVEQYYRINILRLSEMYLIRAEARCMQDNFDGAVEDLKVIMARATNKEISTISNSEILTKKAINEKVIFSKNDLMERIKEERNKELCFEGHCFFDIARWGDDVVRCESTNSSVKRLAYPDYRFVLPIPQIEMDVNDAMQQQPGF